MAPALPLAPRDEPEALHDPCGHSHRRRALVSVDNRATPMEEDDMGLPNQPSLAKDSQEMEQILVDLGGGDIGHPDLLQAIKTLETAGDALSTGDPDAIFQFSGLDLADGGDSEGDVFEEKIKYNQARLERRCAFLQRRLRILQLRSIGKRVSEEAVQTFDKCTRGARKDGGGRPMGLKAFLKKVETTAALQASAASRTVVGPKHYNASTSKGDVTKSASMGITPGTLTGLEDTAGALKKHLTIVQRQLDSDATLSSSGAESNDETVPYNNPHQEHLPISERALWRWQRRRAGVASRWCWLQAQVQELDYKIRQHDDLHRQVREAKGPVEFEGEPVGYEGSLPGAEIPENDPATETCARVRPLRRETFKKRKLLQMHNLHIATPTAAKPSDISCRCVFGSESCPVCLGRGEPTLSGAPAAAAHVQHARALIDPAYHPVLSDAHDASPAVHLGTLPLRVWARGRGKASRGAHHSANHAANHAASHAAQRHAAPQHNTPRSKRHPTKLKRGRPPLSRKIRDRERDDETTSGHDRSRGRSSTETRYRRQSYDIDNIVIPQSIAANTRPQILTYKEIVTPKWRVMELPETPLNNGVSKSSNRLSVESEEEDISEQAVAARHRRAERNERTRFAQNHRELLREQQRQQRREQQRELELQQQQQTTQEDVCQQPQHETHREQDDERSETVRPYTPRQFPLPDEIYHDMVAAMPDGYRHASPEPPAAPPPPALAPPTLATLAPDEDRSSSLSPMSPSIFDGDDPDDAEWDPNAEKAERRKSAFR